MLTYQTREDIILSEDGKKYIVYGVEAVDTQGTIVLSFPDVFFDQQKAKDLAALCNESELALFHLPDVIQDALEEQYRG